MEEQKKLGTTYKMLRALGFNYSEEAYGDVTMGKLLDKVLGNIYKKRREDDGLADIAAYQSSWPASMDIEAFGMQSRQGVFHR